MSYSEANHASVNLFVIQHTEGMYGAMKELMKRRNSLMLKNHNIICREFLQFNVIYQSHFQQGSKTDQFLFSDFHYLCLEGYNFIKKSYSNFNTINLETNLDKTISVFNLELKN